MKHKLYTKASDDFQVPTSSSGGHIFYQPAGGMPLITWPNGSWCYPANVYILELLKCGLSHANGGGTLLTYTANISHIIRFCATNMVDFTELNDSFFTLFVKTLQAESKSSNGAVLRNTNTVINIARCSLDLIVVASRLRGLKDFVSPTGVIKAEKHQNRVTSRRQRALSTWHHHSFPTPDPLRVRLPITDDDHSRLMSAAAQTKHIFIRKRRFLMLHLLECTGCRRSELVRVRISDVLEMTGKRYPMLRVSTSKKKRSDVSERKIPVSPADVAVLVEYIVKNRAPVIAKTIGRSQDHGFLLISHTSGQPLRANTVTQELYSLSHAANLDTSTSPHMYRHRFITKLFIHMIRLHSFHTEDAFRRSVLSTETLKHQILEWTGHSSIESLDPYLHLAFAQALGFDDVLETTIDRKKTSSFYYILQHLADEIKNGLSRDEISDFICRLIDSHDG